MSYLDQIRKLTDSFLMIDTNLKEVLDHLPICIHEISMDGIITSMNQNGIDMLIGLKEEDIIGAKYMDFISDDDKKIVKEHWDKAKKGELNKFTFRGKKGRKFLSCFSPVIEEDKITRVAGFSIILPEDEH
ncbi:PAS domain S-box protein [archaeon]|jgi:PAS domain S-box-containing protein|nr:PAS domain S-box protein [archaeon]